MNIRTNVIAERTINNIKSAAHKSERSMQKLSSGLRINIAADDAAGLAISEKMRAQIRGLEQASRNAQDGISLIQTAEGGLARIIDPPLQRMRELALQASNDTLTAEDRIHIQEEIDHLKKAIDGIAKRTSFNGIPVLSSEEAGIVSVTSRINSYGGTRVEIHSVAGDTIEETVSNIIKGFNLLKSGEAGNNDSRDVAQHWTLSSPTENQVKLVNNSGFGYILGHNSEDGDISYSGGWSNSFTINNLTTIGGDSFGALEIVDNNDSSGVRDDLMFIITNQKRGTIDLQIGANEGNKLSIEKVNVGLDELGIKDLSVGTFTEAQNAIDTIDNALSTALSERARLGAYQNRLEHTIENLTNTSENLIASESRIRDVDISTEIMAQTKYSILQQASQALLAQSNQSSTQILELLK